MNIKNIIVTLAALAFTALSAWKGPTVAGAIFGALVAVCVLVQSLHIVPPSAQEYIDDLEDALQKNAPEAAKKVVKSDDSPKGVATMLVLVGLSCGIAGNTTACSGNPQQDANTANTYINGFLDSAQYACTQLSQITSAPQLAIVCGFINMGDKLAPAVEHFIESLILGRQAALSRGMMFDRAGMVWFKPDGGAQ